MAQHQCEHSMWVNKIPLRVDCADAIRVTVCRQADMRLGALDSGYEFNQIAGNWFRMDTAKTRIQDVTNFAHMAARTRQDAHERASPSAPHRVGHDVEFALRDFVQIDQRAEMLVIQPGGIEAAD